MTFKNTLNIRIILLAAITVFTLAACEKGPAEKTGEKIDNVATDVGNAIEDKCEDVKEGVKAKDTDC